MSEGIDENITVESLPEDYPQYDLSFKLIFIGDSGVGKSGLTSKAVKNTFVMKTGLFINKEMNTLWIKDVSGNVRTFDLQEIVEMDERDKEIIALKRQIEEMKGMINNAESVNTNVDDEIAETKPTRVSTNKRTNAK